MWECRHNGQCNISQPSSGVVEGDTESIVSDTEGTTDGPIREINTYKNDATLRDQQSTGRKRAAIMYPLAEDDDCEWKMRKNCGGGKHPITGCADGKQQARHHGPDKNTLNNDEGNVHRICHQCHNRWHSRNDEGYVWGSVIEPHSPAAANTDDIIENELKWMGKKLTNVVD